MDNVAIVTGAGRGIGRAIATKLADNGASVVLAARTGAELETVAKEIRDGGGRALVCRCDVTREEDVKRLVGACMETYGRLDILVNNAGVGRYGPLASTSTEDWDLIMAVNARGPFLLCREAIPHLRAQSRSFIINIASVVGHKGYINQSAYSASKHALLGMSKSLAKEVQTDGIRVHAICPGAVDSEMARQARPDIDPATYISPEEIADIVQFLVTRKGPAAVDRIDVRRDSSTPWA